MKKMILLFTIGVLSACSSSQILEQKMATQTETQRTETVKLTPPKKAEIGFVQLGKSAYYVDTSSVFVENNKINFDTVLNLSEGSTDFPDKNLVTRSVRQHKVLDCKAQKLTHTNARLYSEFWGKGETVETAEQNKYTITLKSHSSLGVVAQIFCANYLPR